MTAIAYRDGIMAADGAAYCNGTLLGICKKIARSPDGWLGAASGDSTNCYLFEKWMDACREFQLSTKGESFGAILVSPDREVFLIDHHDIMRPAETAPFYADGCASDILIGAMAAGATAEEAVAIAIQWDNKCGGPIQVERL